jgi:hypothetical protein
MTTEQLQEINAIREELAQLVTIYDRMPTADRTSNSGAIVRRQYSTKTIELNTLKGACDHTKPDGNPAVSPFLSWDKCAICNALIGRQ